MPCRDYPSDYASDYEATQEKLDEVTAMLCAVCTRIEKLATQKRIARGEVDAVIKANRVLRAWWAKHKEHDRKRMDAERKAILEKRKRLANELRKLDATLTGDEHEDQYREPKNGDPLWASGTSSTISIHDDGSSYSVDDYDYDGDTDNLVWNAQHQAWTDEAFEEHLAEEEEEDEDDEEEVVNPEIGDIFLLRHDPNTKGVDRKMKVIRVATSRITVVDAHGRNKKVVPRAGLTLDDETNYLINPAYETSLRKSRR